MELVVEAVVAGGLTAHEDGDRAAAVAVVADAAEIRAGNARAGDAAREAEKLNQDLRLREHRPPHDRGAAWETEDIMLLVRVVRSDRGPEANLPVDDLTVVTLAADLDLELPDRTDGGQRRLA